MLRKAINTIALVFNLAGVAILFRYGMPFHVPTAGAIPIITEQRDTAAVTLEGEYTLLGYVGLALLILGTILQLAVTWVPSKAR